MRLIISSDWHCDVKTSGFPRFDDVAAAARQTVAHAIAVKADLWAFLGDLADPDDGPDALRAVELAVECAVKLGAARIRNLWVMGNHDSIESGEGRSTLSPLCALGGWTVVAESPLALQDNESVVIALPYSPASRPYDLSVFVREIVEQVERPGGHGSAVRGVVLGHATHIVGARQGEETLEMPRGRAVRLPVEEFPLGWFVANGHLHTPQTTPSGVHIPGSLACLTHGESHTPRFLTVEV